VEKIIQNTRIQDKAVGMETRLLVG